MAANDSSYDVSRTGKRSREFYNDNWENVIKPEIEQLIKDPRVSCPSLRRARKRIWKAYKAFNKHCSNNYMQDPEGLLDRHKVSACYMYAVAVARPLKIDCDVPSDSPQAIANERLAVTLGISILLQYMVGLLEAVKNEDGEDLPPLSADLLEDIDREIDSLKKGDFSLPKNVGHGSSYIESVYRALAFTHREGNYNILLLALIIYHWECEELKDKRSEMHRMLLSMACEGTRRCSHERAGDMARCGL